MSYGRCDLQAEVRSNLDCSAPADALVLNHHAFGLSGRPRRIDDVCEVGGRSSYWICFDFSRQFFQI